MSDNDSSDEYLNDVYFSDDDYGEETPEDEESDNVEWTLSDVGLGAVEMSDAGSMEDGHGESTPDKDTSTEADGEPLDNSPETTSTSSFGTILKPTRR